MNLGIEDAYVFAACATDFLNGQAGRLEDYHRLRHGVDGEVVRNVRRMTSLIRARSPLADLARRRLPPLAARMPFLINAALRVGMGLDHPVRVR
jgi:2-polyprenyl-6-methoxyphenol hydroxylase-like FAD-dependent oxidoreductase